MLALAERRAHELSLDVEFRLGDAQQLDFSDEEFDTVVATLLLSTVPDPERALSEMRRVLRPGGRLLLLDFARSPIAPVRWIEKALQPLTARSRFSLLRDPLDRMSAVGFALEHVDRFRFGVIEGVVARKT
jgi:ubiquinone/menaquinone biosynthesis C-methylase UbiE